MSAIGREQIVGPLHRAARACQPLRHHSTIIEIKRLPDRIDLLEARSVRIMNKGDLVGAACDTGWFVEGGPADIQAVRDVILLLKFPEVSDAAKAGGSEGMLMTHPKSDAHIPFLK